MDAFSSLAVEQLQLEGALSFLSKSTENTYYAPFNTNELQFIYG
jgi:hypothetical protein